MPDKLQPLVERAQAGDREAANELAKAVHFWCIKKARDYENRFKGVIQADDFISVGMAKLLPCIKSYRPGPNRKFISYFASAASRVMVDLFESTKKQVGEADGGDSGETLAAREEEEVHDESSAVVRA